MECPSCKYPVPAEWSMCRRCGAPLHSEPEDNAGGHPADDAPPPSRAPASPTPAKPASTSASLAAVAAAARNGPPDTLLPGALPRPDNLLPRPTRAAPAAPRAQARRSTEDRRPGSRIVRGRHWRRVLGARRRRRRAHDEPRRGVAGRVQHRRRTPAPSTRRTETVAVELLKTVVGGGRALYAQHNSFATVDAGAAEHLLVPGAGRRARRRSRAIGTRVDAGERRDRDHAGHARRRATLRVRARRAEDVGHAVRDRTHRRLPRDRGAGTRDGSSR